jgi:hypothetical protein
LRNSLWLSLLLRPLWYLHKDLGVEVLEDAVGIEPVCFPLGEILSRILVVKPDAWLPPWLDGLLASILVCHLELLLLT